MAEPTFSSPDAARAAATPMGSAPAPATAGQEVSLDVFAKDVARGTDAQRLALAQQLRVFGYESQKPISGVQLVDKKSKASTTTTEEGIASLSEFQVRNPLTFSLLGYKNKTLSWEELEALNYLICFQSIGNLENP